MYMYGRKIGNIESAIPLQRINGFLWNKDQNLIVLHSHYIVEIFVVKNFSSMTPSDED